jgi:hypothetical protein
VVFPVENRYSTWHEREFETLMKKSKTHLPRSTKMLSLVLTLTEMDEAL